MLKYSIEEFTLYFKRQEELKSSSSDADDDPKTASMTASINPDLASSVSISEPLVTSTSIPISIPITTTSSSFTLIPTLTSVSLPTSTSIQSTYSIPTTTTTTDGNQFTSTSSTHLSTLTTTQTFTSNLISTQILSSISHLLSSEADGTLQTITSLVPFTQITSIETLILKPTTISNPNLNGSTSSSSHLLSNTGALVGVILGIGLGLIITIGTVLLIVLKRKRSRDQQNAFEDELQMGSDFGDHGLYRDESTLFDLNHHSIRSSHSLHQDRFLSSPTADFKLSNETFWGINDRDHFNSNLNLSTLSTRPHHPSSSTFIDSNSRSEEGLRNTLSFQEMNSIDPILSNLTLSHPILTNVPPTSFDLEDRSSTPKPNVPLLQGSEDQRRPIEPIQDRSGDSRGQSDDLMGHFDSSRRVPIDSHLSRMTLDEVDRGRIWNEDLSQFGPRVSSIDESHQFHSPLFFEESQERRDEEDGGVEWFNDLDDGSDDRLDRNLLRNELRQEEEDEVEDQISLNDQTDYSRRILMVSNPDDET